MSLFYQREPPPCADKRVELRDLEADPDFARFRAEHGHRRRKGYKFDALRFAHKVFALTAAPRDSHWLIWIDADVVTQCAIDSAYLERVLPDAFELVLLERRDWNHSETGFVGYNLSSPQVQDLLDELRHTYTSARLFDMEEWHDAWALDRLRSRHQLRTFNLSSGAAGLHVWPQTVLGERMTHFKGKRKLEISPSRGDLGSGDPQEQGALAPPPTPIEAPHP